MTTALLIVDAQQGFMDASSHHVLSAIQNLQHNYSYVAASRFVNTEASPYRRLIGFYGMSANSDETALAFRPASHVFIFDKHVYSCLVDDFASWLADRQIESVHICGVRTENCVLKTAVDLFETNHYKPVVYTNYCYSPYKHLHEAACHILPTFIGEAQVIDDA